MKMPKIPTNHILINDNFNIFANQAYIKPMNKFVIDNTLLLFSFIKTFKKLLSYTIYPVHLHHKYFSKSAINYCCTDFATVVRCPQWSFGFLALGRIVWFPSARQSCLVF